jgi:dTMP kinase
MNGKFIVFEGIDGSGKSTQAEKTFQNLSNSVLTKEQTEGLMGQAVQKILNHKYKTSPLALQILFTSDRADHIFKEIEPYLKQGKTVVSDRYALSTIAYGGKDCDIEYLKRINSIFRKPDLTIIIDTDVDTALSRLNKRVEDEELFEKKEFLEKIRKNYLDLIDYYPNTHIIDGNGSIEEVNKKVMSLVSELK